MYKKKNFAKSVLSSSISAVDTSLSITTSTAEANKFPAVSEKFMAVIWGSEYSSPEKDPNREIVEADKQSGLAWYFDIVRAKEGTTANSWDTGDNFMLIASAGVFDEYETAINNVLEAIYPVGAVYVSGSSTMPSLIANIGTWARIEGRFIVGASDTDGDFDNGDTGGHKEMQQHQHTMNQHRHSVYLDMGNDDNLESPTSSSVGALYPTDDQPYTKTKYTNYTTSTMQYAGTGDSGNLPPYKAKYMWERTA